MLVDTLTIRLHWYSGPSVFGLSAIALCVVVGFFSPGVFAVAALLAVFWACGTFGLKIEVTSDEVRMTIWLIRRQAVPRAAIAAMHWYSGKFTLVDADDRVLLKASFPGLTRGQLLDLSEALGVRLYNHRTKRGLGNDSRQGQLMERASQSS
jgi:hypothetical protein